MNKTPAEKTAAVLRNIAREMPAFHSAIKAHAAEVGYTDAELVYALRRCVKIVAAERFATLNGGK